jgi:hypothetical protein
MAQAGDALTPGVWRLLSDVIQHSTVGTSAATKVCSQAACMNYNRSVMCILGPLAAGLMV